MFALSAPFLPAVTESAGHLLSTLANGGRFLLTLSMALFLSYLFLVFGALLLALVRRSRPDLAAHTLRLSAAQTGSAASAEAPR